MVDRIRLDGKVAVVTGAGGEIGTATMQLLAQRGARIVAVDRDSQQLQRAISGLPAAAEAMAVTADVTREDDVAGYVRQALERMGRIDIFHNNAGIEGEMASIPRYSLDMFRRVLDVNVIGVFLGMKHVLPVMYGQNAGSIVNTASVAGLKGGVDVSAYIASKHAVVGLTKSAALECAGTKVRVNCVCPGPIEGRMWTSIVEGRKPNDLSLALNQAAQGIPARRFGDVSEVAAVVAFLASDDASYVSGSAYSVDGGRSGS
jgi:NAD(P)-dependent dehydrogenase (short-subunit alcohol dehydrogenase family)